MNKYLKTLIVLGVALMGLVLFFGASSWGTAALWNLSHEGRWLLPLVGVAALIDSINPCAFGILLLTIGFLLSLGKTRLGILKIGGAYIIGLLAVYFLIGLGIFQALHLFNTPHFMAKIGAGILIAWGVLNLIGQWWPSFPIKLRLPQMAHHKIAALLNKASLPTALALGALVGLCEFPCTGGPYLMVLGLLRDQTTYLTGVAYLLLYNVIFVLPLVIILAMASHGALINKVQGWKKSQTPAMRIWGGLAMIILGLIIFLI